MVKAYRVHKVGGPEAMIYEEFELPRRGRARSASTTAPSASTSSTSITAPAFIPRRDAVHSRRRGGGRGDRGRPGRDRLQDGRPGRLCRSLGGYAEERNMPAAIVVKLPDGDLRRDGGGDDAEGPHGAISAAPHLQGESRRHDPVPCRGRRRRADRVPVGQAPGRDGHRHGRRQGEGGLAEKNGCDHVDPLP